MRLLTWWTSDPPLAPSQAPRLRPRVVTARDEVSRVAGLDADEAATRQAQGHRLYVAYARDDPAALAWVTAGTSALPSLGRTVSLLPGERLVWGLGPAEHTACAAALARAITRHEPADRFWILCESDGVADALLAVGFLDAGAPSVAASGPAEEVEPRGAAAARLFAPGP